MSDHSEESGVERARKYLEPLLDIVEGNDEPSDRVLRLPMTHPDGQKDFYIPDGWWCSNEHGHAQANADFSKAEFLQAIAPIMADYARAQRREVVEECAKIADNWKPAKGIGRWTTCAHIAATIRDKFRLDY